MADAPKLAATAWQRALSLVVDKLAGLAWALAGSAASSLQGLALEVHDLDILADAKTAYRIAAQLEEFVTLPMAWRETEQFISHFGRFFIEGTVVEVMGNLSIRGRGCIISFHPSSLIWKNLKEVSFDGHPLRLVPLEAQLVANLIVEGKGERARAIAAYLKGHGCDVELIRGLVIGQGLESVLSEEIWGLLGETG